MYLTGHPSNSGKVQVLSPYRSLSLISNSTKPPLIRVGPSLVCHRLSRGQLRNDSRQIQDAYAHLINDIGFEQCSTTTYPRLLVAQGTQTTGSFLPTITSASLTSSAVSVPHNTQSRVSVIVPAVVVPFSLLGIFVLSLVLLYRRRKRRQREVGQTDDSQEPSEQQLFFDQKPEMEAE